MAIFNITNGNVGPETSLREFRASNNNIHVDTLKLRVSQLYITEAEWNGNF